MNKLTPITAAPADGVHPLAPSATQMPCLECGGEGTGEYMALTEDSYHVRRCHICDGTGLVDPYCETCQGKLTDGLCRDCDYPSGWFLAERSALGVVKP